MITRHPALGLVPLITGALLVCASHALRAQSGAADVERRGMAHGGARPPEGFYRMLARDNRAFEFRHGWLERSRAVRRNRQLLRARSAWRLLNATAAGAVPAGAPTAVAGALRYPTFMVFFANTGPADSALFDSTQVAGTFWGTAPAPPYSITTYYQELSVGRLTVSGSVIRRGIRVSQNDTFYAGPGICRGLCGSSRVPNLISELLQHADSTVDFSRFVDTSTGYVPAIVILDPQVGGECYLVNSAANRSIWAHRYAYSGWTGAPYQTNDPWPGHPGQFVKVDDYIIQGGQGGSDGCTSGQLAPIGTVTHETGHLFGLPDLYDTQLATEGLGFWDLMSAGNELQPYRPAHMSAWSLATLGWVAEVPVTAPMTVTAGPIEASDSAFIVPLAGTSGNEFYLLENRQPVGSDSMLMGPGLLVYHLDAALMAQRMGSNLVNAIFPHALWLVEADNLNQLNSACGRPCRGDAGDPFPGTAANTAFGFGTTPAATTNGGGFAGVVVDSIQQLAPFGPIRFRVTFPYLLVAASDTDAVVTVDGTPAHVFRSFVAAGSTHIIAIDSSQISADGRTQFLFQAWSDGGARTHSVTGSIAGGTYTATVSRAYQVKYAVSGAGTVAATRPLDPTSGGFLAGGDSVTLTAAPGAGQTFAGWTGDTTARAPALLLRSAKPFAVTANFVAGGDVVTQLLTGRSRLTAVQMETLDLLGNSNGRFDLGDFVAWLDRNAGAVSAAVAGRAARRAAR